MVAPLAGVGKPVALVKEMSLAQEIDTLGLTLNFSSKDESLPGKEVPLYKVIVFEPKFTDQLLPCFPVME